MGLFLYLTPCSTLTDGVHDLHKHDFHQHDLHKHVQADTLNGTRFAEQQSVQAYRTVVVALQRALKSHVGWNEGRTREAFIGAERQFKHKSVRHRVHSTVTSLEIKNQAIQRALITWYCGTYRQKSRRSNLRVENRASGARDTLRRNMPRLPGLQIKQQAL